MALDDILFKEHLKTLNIGAIDVSFGWLLDDGNEILNWFYNNINCNNCVTLEEKSKFLAIEEAGDVLTGDELNRELNVILNKYEGMVVPLGEEILQEEQRELDDLQEMYDLLLEQQANRDKLLSRDREINVELAKAMCTTAEILGNNKSRLIETTRQCEELVILSRNEKLKYFDKIEEILKMCSAVKKSDENLFISVKPLELYFERTKVLEVYLKHYISKQFGNEVSVHATEDHCPAVGMIGNVTEDLSFAELKITEKSKKLQDALWFYVKSKAEHCGLVAQIKFIENYDVDCCYDARFEKIKNAGLIEVLEKDIETLIQREMTVAINTFINKKNEEIMLGEVQLKLEKTKYLYDKLCSTADVVQQALNENNLLLLCLKNDQNIVENLLKFSIDTLSHLQSDILASEARCFQFKPLIKTNAFLKSLYTLFEVDATTPVPELVKKIQLIQADVIRMEKVVFRDTFCNYLEMWKDGKYAGAPLRKMIWDGPTSQPSICNSALANAVYELKIQNLDGDKKIRAMTNSFLQFKQDSQDIIKSLWMWFLSEPHKIRALKDKVATKPSVFKK